MSSLDTFVKLKFKYSLIGFFLFAFTFSISAQGEEEFILSGNIASIGGKIGTNVKVTFTSVIEILETYSGADGNYEIKLKPNIYYEIKLKKNTTYLNGVTPMDIVIGQQVLLGFKEANEYQKFAMDVNGDMSFRSNDLIDIKKHMIGIQQIYRDKFYFLHLNGFSNVFDQYFTVISDGEDVVKDFVIIKKGDIDDSADY